MNAENFRYSYNPRLLPVPLMQEPMDKVFIPKMHKLKTAGKIARRLRELRGQDLRLLKEAEDYTPPFTEEITQPLVRVLYLLDSQGYPAFRINKAENNDEKVVFKTEKNTETNGVTRRDIRRTAYKLLSLVHSDYEDKIISNIFTMEERQLFVQEIQNAMNSANYNRMQELHLEIYAPYLVEKVRSMLNEGKSFEKIAKEYPHIIPEMAGLNKSAVVHLPDETILEKEVKTSDKVAAEAKKKKRKNEIRDKAFGALAIHITIGHIASYAELIHTEDSVRANLTELHNLSKEVFGMTGLTSEKIISEGEYKPTRPETEKRLLLEESIRLIPILIYRIARIITGLDKSDQQMEGVVSLLKERLIETKAAASQYREEVMNKTTSGLSVPPIVKLFNPWLWWF